MEKFSEIIGGDTLTLVDFYATWCGPCMEMAPVVEQLKKDFGSRIRVIKVDIDRNEPLLLQYGVTVIPTMFLFRKGKQLWSHSGVVDLSILKEEINRYL
ncbi:MAG: thioredoxin family protein [Bacteroidales bacterium]|nr:thioredoxin family protein [Candidatus Colimorpha onthohippi]